MILTLTPSPALDVTYRVDALVPGAVHRVDAPGIRAGGKGVNVARVLHEAGEDALAIVPLGGIEGDRALRDLEDAGVAVAAVAVARPTRSTVTIVDARGATGCYERPGALDDAEVERLERAVLVALPGASALVVSGALPPGLGAAWVAMLVEAAGRARVPIVADVAGDALVAAASAGADVLKPNLDELREATGLREPAAAAASLVEAGARLVVASLGAEGMLAVDASGGVVRGRLDAPVEGNPTGAGDAAVAALASSFGLPLADRVRRAIAWSAAAVAQPLAGSIGDPTPYLARVRLEAS